MRVRRTWNQIPHPLLAAPVCLAGCPGFPTQVPPNQVEIVQDPTWENAIAPLFAVYCDSCHSVPATGGAPGYLRTDTYDTVGGVTGAAALADRHLARGPPTSAVRCRLCLLLG